MHMTDQEKAKIGGRLARIFNLKLDPESGRYMLGEGYLTKTAIGVFEVVRDVAIHKEYCEAVKKAVEALESVSRDCQMALNDTWDRGDHGFHATRDSVDDALRGFGVEPPVEEAPDEEED